MLLPGLPRPCPPETREGVQRGGRLPDLQEEVAAEVQHLKPRQLEDAGRQLRGTGKPAAWRDPA